MKEVNTFFPVGATYAPLAKATEVDIAQWPADIERMAKLGLTVFRAFICWDRIEKVPGQRDYSSLDLVFDLAQKNGLKVIGNVGGTFTNLQAIYPPRHLVYDRHCALLKPTPDASEELRFNRFKLCYDDPVYQREAAEFIREVVARYKDHPALLAWSGWNEPRLSPCYCKNTVALYREWLAKKYGDLDTLAKAWSTEFPVYFRGWDDVNPQPEASFEAGGYIPFLDWKQFTYENRTDKFNLVADWIRSADPDTPVISHMCSTNDSDIFGKEDILGSSSYTIHGQGKNPHNFTPYEFTYRYNIPLIAKGFRKHRQDPYGFWIVETEAGPVSWVHNLVPRSYSPRQMNARDMMFVAHGARAILRWLYRSRISDAQAGEFNLVGWDGRITERAAEFGEFSKFLNDNSARMLHHIPDNLDILILDSNDCWSLFEAEGFGARYSRGMTYLYNALMHSGYNARVCNNRQVMEGILDESKVLFIPFRPHVDRDMAEVLRKFVEKGGTLIAEAPFAIKDTKGIHYEVTPGTMTDLFGAQVYDLERLEESVCGPLPAFDFKAIMEVKGGTVEAAFADGKPAIVTNIFGLGKTVLYGSQVSIAYKLEKPQNDDSVPVIDFETGEIFRQELIKRVGLAPVWKLEAANRKNIQIFVRRLPDGKKLIFVLNMDEVSSDLTVEFPALENIKPLGTSCDTEKIEIHGNKVHCQLNEWGWCVLNAEKKS